MSPQQMRQAILSAYPGANWPAKVSKMSDQQVFVVYTRLRNSKKI